MKKMDISNKTLAMFLVAAIVVSIAGTTISLNKLGDMTGPTGFATSDVGNVTVTVGDTLSIRIDSADNDISFGSCTPVGGQDIILDSENTGSTASDNCAGGNYPDNLIVINDGNINANVSVNVSNVGETHGGNFLGNGGESWLAYKTTNVASDCTGTNVGSYANFSAASVWHVACTNLTPGDFGIQFDVQTQLFSNATSAPSYSEVTFWAKNV